MGGRLSKQRTSVVLGKGEGAFITSPKKQREHGFYLDGYTFDQLWSMTRLVDAGAGASHVWCPECCTELVALLWPGLEFTLEEEGEDIRVLDMSVRWENDEWNITPADKGDRPLGPDPSIRVARYTPRPLVPDPIEYIKSLMYGRLSRIHQIMEEDTPHSVQGILRLFHELTNKVNRFSWHDCEMALKGARVAWARASMRRVKWIVSNLAIIEDKYDS